MGDSCLRKKPFALNLCTLAQASPIDSVVLHPPWCPQVGDWGLPCPLNGRVSSKMFVESEPSQGNFLQRCALDQLQLQCHMLRWRKKSSTKLFGGNGDELFFLRLVSVAYRAGPRNSTSRKDVKRSSLHLPRSRALPKALAPNVVGGLDGLCSLKLA